MVGTITGILMALFFNNAGGAWDAYVETGVLGGSPTPTRRPSSATPSETVQGHRGPVLHVPHFATITLVLAPLFL